MSSVRHQMRNRWPIMQRTHWAFTSFKCLTYYCHSSRPPFVRTRLFSLSDGFSATHHPSHLSHSLPLGPLLVFSAPLLSSLYATACALLRISSAGFEAISVCDHYQTLPSEEAGAEGEDGGRRWGRERAADSRKERGDGNIGGRNFIFGSASLMFSQNDNKGILYLGV